MTDLFSAVAVGYAGLPCASPTSSRPSSARSRSCLRARTRICAAGQEALAAGDGMAARAAAHRVLAQAPDSPLGLALLADACETAHLDAELALTLEELARRAPSSAEVWVRLARARQATGGPPEEVRDPFVRALAVAGVRERRTRSTPSSASPISTSRRETARAQSSGSSARRQSAPGAASPWRRESRPSALRKSP